MHWIAREALVVSIFFTALLSFQVFITVDDAQPAGTQSAFSVERVDSLSKQAAIRTIEAAASNTGTNIYKIQPGARDSTRSRTLFAFLGDHRQFQQQSGFAYFTFSSQPLSTTVTTADQITTEDLRGRYVTTADHAQTATILAALHRAKITAGDDTVPGPQLFLYALGPGNLGAAFVVVYVALALAIAYSETTNRRAHAIKSLHGYSRAPILGAELTSAGMAFGVGLAALVAIGVPVLGAVTGFHQMWRFAGVLDTGLGILAAFTALLVTALGGAATLRHRVPEVIKGERLPLADGVLAILAQVIVLAVVLGSVSGAMWRIEAVTRTTHELGRWTQMTPAYALRLNTAGQHGDNVHDAPALASIIDRMDRQGKVLMAGYEGGQLANGGADVQPSDPGGANSMIVNPTYLKVQPVLDADSHRISSVATGRDNFTLLVPTSYHGDLDTLLATYTTYFKGFACLLGAPKGTPPCHPRGRVIRTATGQTLFTYKGTTAGPAELQDRLSLDDPVLVVVAPSSGLIGPSQYLSYTSQDAVLFFDAAELDRQLTRAGICGSFQGIDNAADAVTDTLAASRLEQRMDMFGIPLGTLVLVLATMVSAAVYCGRRRRTSFVQLIHGYGFTRRHGTLLAGDLILASLTAAAALAIGHMHRPRDLAAAAILIAAQVGVAAAFVRVYEARSRADFIKRP